jgi:hypothetical protein
LRRTGSETRVPTPTGSGAVRPASTLLVLRSSSAYSGAAGIALLVRRSLLVLGAIASPSTDYAGPRGLPGCSAACVTREGNQHPPTKLRHLQSLATCRPPRLMLQLARLTLTRFRAPSARSTCRVHSTRACLTRYVPPPGFPTLLTAYSSAGYPALFHAGALMEFPTLQSFSLVRSRSASRRSHTLLPFAGQAIRALQGAVREPRWWPRGTPRGDANTSLCPFTTFPETRQAGSTSGRCSPGRVRCKPSAVRPRARPMLSWV